MHVHEYCGKSERSEKKLKLLHNDSPHALVFNYNDTNPSVPHDICYYQHRKHHSDHGLGWIGRHDGFSFSFRLQFLPKRQLPKGIKLMLLEILKECSWKKNCNCNLQFSVLLLMETVFYKLWQLVTVERPYQLQNQTELSCKKELWITSKSKLPFFRQSQK